MKALLYCTKGKVGLYDNRKKITGALENFFLDKLGYDKPPLLNGKIVAECDFEVEEISVTYADYYHEELAYDTNTLTYDELLEKSCLDNQQLDNYLYGDNGYAIHIENLHIFEEQKYLSDYFAIQDSIRVIKKAPQNMMYCWEYTYNKYELKIFERCFKRQILISIRPEWLCKILNGEKTIEVRKKVLKEMLK